MADLVLNAEPILGGADISIGDNRILERDDLAMVSLAVPLKGETKFRNALKKAWKLALPSPTLSSVSGEIRLVQMTADQMMLIFLHEEPNANSMVKAKMGDTAYTTDQTDGWVILEASGPDTLAALERICPLDLDLSVFPVDASGRTVMEHMGALIIRLAEDRFLLASASSSAKSFLHAVENSYRYVVAQVSSLQFI